MKIAVISDLHLGVADRVDGFGHADADFLRFLKFLEHEFERIVLLGDIWETLMAPALGDPVTALRGARVAHRDIARRFELPPYSYVHGNHDLVAGIVDGAPEQLVIEDDGVRILFTHGHHHDLLFRSAQWLSELGVWLGGWLLRLGLSPLYQVFRRLDDARSGVVSDPASCPFQRWAVGVAHQQEADVVVTGHTHVPARGEHGDRLFLNSGSCAEGQFSFSAIDTRAGKYGVHSWA